LARPEAAANEEVEHRGTLLITATTHHRRRL
jgi:hypothetical protein